MFYVVFDRITSTLLYHINVKRQAVTLYCDACVGRGLVCGQGGDGEIGVGQHCACAQVASRDDDVNGVLRLGPEGQEDEGEGEEAEEEGEDEGFLAHGRGRFG